MTIEEAIQIVNPETALKGLAHSFNDKYCMPSQVLLEARQLAADELRKRRWISVKDRLPEPEQEVLVFVDHKNGYNKITTALYENGKIATGDSCWQWYDLDFDYDYDEERDEYLIPQGWWEYRHYNSDEVYNNCIDGEVTYWMPLPEPPKAPEVKADILNITRFTEAEISRAINRTGQDHIEVVRILSEYDRGIGDIDDIIDAWENEQ